jgi:glycosyltransferase involved in cell wall biosynthesis
MEDHKMRNKLRPTVSIIIKALNEERHVASAIESALAALDGMDGEVILADSASTDRTLDIARKYPIKIVRLNHIVDRSCGVGAQLGFQYSSGSYLCLIDGDMRLRLGFLPAAIRFLEDNPRAAGVGGMIIEREMDNREFSQRMKRADPDREPGAVTRLDCSGVYRRSAIESVGYLTDRNLHAGEELDLGARLHAGGWMLARIGVPAVDHHGHGGSAFRLLLRRVRTRLAFGMGEVVRAAVGRPHFWFVVRNDKKVPLCLLVFAWWLTIAATAFVLSGVSRLIALGLVVLFPFAVMSLRWRSLHDGIYSVTAWNVFALSFLPGFMQARVPPMRWIDSTVLREVPPAKPIVQFRQARAAATPAPMRPHVASSSFATEVPAGSLVADPR